MRQVMADEGVVAPISDYVQVYLNGKFYGLYGIIEKVRCSFMCQAVSVTIPDVAGCLPSSTNLLRTTAV
jgi:hypothetical protein